MLKSLPHVLHAPCTPVLLILMRMQTPTSMYAVCMYACVFIRIHVATEIFLFDFDEVIPMYAYSHLHSRLLTGLV